MDEHIYDCEIHDHIEEQDGKDGPQEGTKEYTRLTYEAARGIGYKIMINICIIVL